MAHSISVLVLLTLLFLGLTTHPVNSDSRSGNYQKLEKSVDIDHIHSANSKSTSVNSVTSDVTKSSENSKIDDSTTQDNTTNFHCENGKTEISNCTEDKTLMGRIITGIAKNKAMLLRTMYVLIALTSIVVIYFLVRSFRLRHKRNKSRKYGLITAPNDLEMAPLDQDEDEDEDMTVFELNGVHKR